MLSLVACGGKSSIENTDSTAPTTIQSTSEETEMTTPEETVAEEPNIPDVMNYTGKWNEMIDELSMTQVSKENSMGDVYEVSDFNIDISTWGKMELRNDGYQDISISGVVLGDDKSSAKEMLENDLWICSSNEEEYSFYLTKKNDEYYYLWMYYSEQNNNIDNWYLANWCDEQFIAEICAGYDTFISVSEEWKKAYIRFIIEYGMNYNDYTIPGVFDENYILVNINGDDIPELYINFGYTGAGSKLCSYYNNSVVYQNMWVSGFSYMEGQNLFRDSGGKMDVYFDKIYSIDNGEFVLRHKGDFGAKDNSNVQIDSNGNPVYDYYWNETQISSEEEYQRLLNDVYNIQQANNPYEGAEYDSATHLYVGNGFCNYKEILQAIVSY